MKSKFEFFSLKASSVVSAFASGILTELLIQFLDFSRYAINLNSNTEGIVYIEQVGSNELIIIALTAVVYIVLFCFLNYVIPFLIFRLRSIKYRGKLRYSKKQIVSKYNDIRLNLISLLDKASEYSDECCFKRMTSSFECISLEVNELYKIFCASSNRNKSSIKSAFRMHEARTHKTLLSDIGHYISLYDYLMLLKSIEEFYDELLCSIVGKTADNGIVNSTPLSQTDFSEMLIESANRYDLPKNLLYDFYTDIIGMKERICKLIQKAYDVTM